MRASGSWGACKGEALQGHLFRQRLRRRRFELAFPFRRPGFEAGGATAAVEALLFFRGIAAAVIFFASGRKTLMPVSGAAVFSDTIPVSSTLFPDAGPLGRKVGQRHQSMMLASMTAAPRSAASRNGELFCAMQHKSIPACFVP